MSPQNAQKRKISPIRLEGATVIWRNFTGAKKQFNPEGIRNFHVVIPDDLAKTLERDGWNIRWHEAKNNEDSGPWASLKVAVRFDKYPPRVVLVTQPSHKQVNLDAESVSILDDADVDTFDLVIVGSFWSNTKGQDRLSYMTHSLSCGYGIGERPCPVEAIKRAGR